MPKELFDADGNAVEAFEKEEFEAVKKAADEREAELKAAKEQLAKMENKEHNFKRLRDMTDAEREKLTATEMELKKRQEALEEESKTFRQQVIDTHKDDALAVLAGDDAELRKKMLLNYDRIKDDAVTKDEINRKMKEAYKLSVEHSGGSMARRTGVSGTSPSAKANQPVSDDLKDLAARMGIKPEDLK